MRKGPSKTGPNRTGPNKNGPSKNGPIKTTAAKTAAEKLTAGRGRGTKALIKIGDLLPPPSLDSSVIESLTLDSSRADSSTSELVPEKRTDVITEFEDPVEVITDPVSVEITNESETPVIQSSVEPEIIQITNVEIQSEPVDITEQEVQLDITDIIHEPETDITREPEITDIIPEPETTDIILEPEITDITLEPETTDTILEPEITDIIPESEPKISTENKPPELIENSSLTTIPADKHYYGVHQIQQRAHEDRFQAVNIDPFRFYVVFDGHGGSRMMDQDHVADYCVHHLHLALRERFSLINPNDRDAVILAIEQVFVAFDREMYEKKLLFGSTCTAILINDLQELGTNKNVIYQINLGDSRSIILLDNNKLSHKNKIVAETVDHEPTTYQEMMRIKAAGGFVTGNRVNGSLMISRAFGDFQLKGTIHSAYDPINGKVSAVPTIRVIEVEYDPMHVILTSDAPFENNLYDNKGLVKLYDEVTNYHGISILDEYAHEQVAKEMCQQIVGGTTDDVTIMVVTV
jgi:serine/threonine protein phosphatase PrpC